ncbi:dihydrofolate reductase family protein [Kitasatospora sp. YST-16]|uniref:dihydrofolate reductase family protein n=1 Tax=Kitasatospora sp. YST-16 TaxID=2998080 RepID=UPI0022849D75|nr:dihydrofolate reductase family protein [Kitasatospora sp. YST-16]WAL71199.1 dihydrofolate reductase family protein [Kitasatospora sp. YST-16]WNW37236.1 dihydrofolate reductase family protein [Streptomyces sp. Li-HN-5-13]
MAKVRVHNFHISLDGYSAGETITLDAPIGGAERLFGYFDGRFIHGVDAVDAPITLDHALTSTWGQGIGAEIMGRGKFGPQTGEWTDDDWRGWWGDEPPFRTPVVVLTHHRRDPVSFDNGTSFHFLDATPEEALARARELAGGLDVRIGGGPSTVRQFLAADLVDFMHLVTVPVTLGAGVSMWDGLAEVQDRFTVESATSASGLTHHFWNRTRG